MVHGGRFRDIRVFAAQNTLQNDDGDRATANGGLDRDRCVLRRRNGAAAGDSGDAEGSGHREPTRGGRRQLGSAGDAGAVSSPALPLALPARGRQSDRPCHGRQLQHRRQDPGSPGGDVASHPGRRLPDDEGGRQTAAGVGRRAVPAAVALDGEDGHGHAQHPPAGAFVRRRDRIGCGPVHGPLESWQTCVAGELGYCRRSHVISTFERGTPASTAKCSSQRWF